jgi:hypothetical protein
MNNRRILFFLITVGIVACAEFFVVVTTIKPIGAGKDVHWTFYVCLYLALTSLVTLVWHQVKCHIYKHVTPPLITSVRQSALVALLVVLGIFFKSLGIVTVWDIIPLIISVILIEFFFQAEKSSPRHEPS